jgi:hypothetical protein
MHENAVAKEHRPLACAASARLARVGRAIHRVWTPAVRTGSPQRVRPVADYKPMFRPRIPKMNLANVIEALLFSAQKPLLTEHRPLACAASARRARVGRAIHRVWTPAARAGSPQRVRPVADYKPMFRPQISK